MEQIRQELEAEKSELLEMTERVDQLGTELARHQHTMQQGAVFTKPVFDHEHKGGLYRVFACIYEGSSGFYSHSVT